MTNEMSTANALGARTARPCDGCLRRRARFYCAADDAFLCSSCDSSVHSANPLARRHRRLPLSPSPSPSPPPPPSLSPSPSWLNRKPRTPRPKPILAPKPDSIPVPDLYESTHPKDEDESLDEHEDLLYQVPVFDPALAELYSPPPPPALTKEEKKVPVLNDTVVKSPTVDGIAGFQISEAELEEFAADMESLLGGPEFDGMGLMEIDRETEIYRGNEKSEEEGEEAEERKKLILKLDYEGVISAWACKGGSPWTDGEKPWFRPDDRWPDFKAIFGGGDGVGPTYKVPAVTDVGREARVSRYREKRRTRLFAKKIRYEVRKLNAEKRPRMKGRFVKRAAAAAFPTAAMSAVPVPVQVPVMSGPFSF